MEGPPEENISADLGCPGCRQEKAVVGFCWSALAGPRAPSSLASAPPCCESLSVKGGEIQRGLQWEGVCRESLRVDRRWSRGGLQPWTWPLRLPPPPLIDEANCSSGSDLRTRAERKEGLDTAGLSSTSQRQNFSCDRWGRVYFLKEVHTSNTAATSGSLPWKRGQPITVSSPAGRSPPPLLGREGLLHCGPEEVSVR